MRIEVLTPKQVRKLAEEEAAQTAELKAARKEQRLDERALFELRSGKPKDGSSESDKPNPFNCSTEFDEDFQATDKRRLAGEVLPHPYRKD